MTNQPPDQPTSDVPVPVLVLDPNVLISAAITGRGPTVQLVQAAAAGVISLVVSPTLLRELQATLERPKFRKYLSLDEAMEFVEAVALVARVVDDPPSTGFAQVCRDPRDDYLIFLAEEVQAAILVSGDKDLLELGRPGLDVRSPAQALGALSYRHPWGPGLIPGEMAAALAQAVVHGHAAVLLTISEFVNVLADSNAADRLPSLVTPESLSSWLSHLDSARALVRDRGLATGADYPMPNIALMKLPPDPGVVLKATGDVPLSRDTVIAILQRRVELPTLAGLDGWRVHALANAAPTAEQLADMIPVSPP